MPNKAFTPEQIVGKLRQIEVLLSQGKTVTCPVFCTNPIESRSRSVCCRAETFGCSLRLHLSFGPAVEDRE